MEKSASSVGGAALESSTGRRDTGFLDDDGVPLLVPFSDGAVGLRCMVWTWKSNGTFSQPSSDRLW